MDNYNWKKIFYWAAFVVFGILSKGTVLILGSFCILAYATYLYFVKKQKKQNWFILSGSAFIVGLILLIQWASSLPPVEHTQSTTKPASKPQVSFTFETTSITTKENEVIIKGSVEPKDATVKIKDGSKVTELKMIKAGQFEYKADTSYPMTYRFEFVGSKNGFEDAKETVLVERQKTAAELKKEEDDFKNSCKTVKYGEIEKSPDKYVGQKVKFKGKILEIQEVSGVGIMRIAVTYMGYDIWNFNDAVWVNYTGTTDAVKDDIVTVYGTMLLPKSYTSQAGWEITIPQMDAKYIEKK
jgi:hypothetical protein